MRVLIIPEFSETGGTREFLLRLLQIHRRHGVQSAVLLPANRLEEEMSTVLEQMNVEVFIGSERKHSLGQPLRSLIYDFSFARRAVERFHPDLIHSSIGTPGHMLGLFGLSTPVLMTLHTIPQYRLSRTWRWAGRVLTGRRKRLHAVSQCCARMICDNMMIPGDRISIIHNCYSEPVCPATQKDELVLTVSHVRAYKNPGLWMRVACRIISERPNVKFVWLGDGELLGAMRQQAVDCDMAGRIVFPGHIHDVASYYARAMVYFQPSLIENHSLAVVDAMARAVPCVTSDVGGMPESVIDGKTGLMCRADDENGFVESIGKLLDNADLREAMGREGKARAMRMFSPKAQEYQFWRLYEELIHR